MLTESTVEGATDEGSARIDEGEPSGNEGDPPDPTTAVASVIACTVWFGPKVPQSAERELLAMLGSHNGVAVLQWPRDSDRAQRCRDLGIPTLCFMEDQAQLPTQGPSGDRIEVGCPPDRLPRAQTPQRSEGSFSLGASRFRVGPMRQHQRRSS